MLTQFITPLEMNLEPLARAFISLNVPHLGDPFQASSSSNSAIKAACSKLQKELFKSFNLSISDFKFISLRCRNQQKNLRSWGLAVNAKRPALLIVPSDGDSFQLSEKDFNKLKSTASDTANKLGLSLITSRFFYETDSPDSGIIYQSHELGSISQNTVKVSFAFCHADACFLSRSRGTQLVQQVYEKIFGNDTNRQRNINLLLDLRKELERAHIK